jgi:mRNA-degrading endonuclease RelE of RelBE toxin-antitoxin system
MNKIEFDELPEFVKDVKTLSKRYRSLLEDLEVLKKVLSDEPVETPPFSYRIEGLGIETCVIKIRKIACKSLKGRGVNSGLRLIYALIKEKGLITFIEIYHKSDKPNEDRVRIFNYFS